MIGSRMFIPVDVREVIDRIDDKSQSIITTLCITGDSISEQTSLLIKQQKLLTEQNNLLNKQNRLLENLVTTLCTYREEERKR